MSRRRNRLSQFAFTLLATLCLLCCMHAGAVVARPAAVPERSWIDKRVDALTVRQLTTLPPQALVDADRATVAESLVAVRRPMFFLWALTQICALFFAWRTGAAAHLRDWLTGRLRNVHLLRFVYTSLGVVYVSLTALPYGIIGFHLARVVGVSHELFREFLRDFVIGVSVELLLTGIAITLTLALVDRFRMWYLYTAAILIAFGFVALVATPVVIDPLFRRATPLAVTSPLGKRLYGIEQRAHVGFVPIFLTNLSRTSEVGNANVEGIGPTRRVLVGDTLLSTATSGEVAFVMAHELGHVAADDPLSLSMLADLLTIAAIACAIFTAERIPVRGDDDPLSRLALIAALTGVYSLVMFPFGNAYSRMVEARADRFSMSVHPDAASGARMFVRFADDGFAPVCPPMLVRLYFYDHPPIGSRIAALTGRPDACR